MLPAEGDTPGGPEEHHVGPVSKVRGIDRPPVHRVQAERRRSVAEKGRADEGGVLAQLAAHQHGGPGHHSHAATPANQATRAVGAVGEAMPAPSDAALSMSFPRPKPHRPPRSGLPFPPLPTSYYRM